MKVAFVKDWLPIMRGAEKVFELMCDDYPEADIYTLFHFRGTVSPAIERHRITTSFVQHMPFVRKHYRYYLPFFPTAVEQFDLSRYDLVISLSQCVAKGAIVPPGALNLCYCLTPMRYIWDMYDVYFPWKRMNIVKKMVVPPAAAYLRRWDLKSSSRVDHFLSISNIVSERIRRWYRRDSEIVFPPGNEEFYTPVDRDREDFYLVASAFAPYKRIDLAIEACKKLGRRLVIIGAGQDEKKLLAAKGKGIEFLGWQPDEVLRDHYRRCRALLFPGEEDFGIVPVEAQMCGAPVIAYGRGGALDTVVEGTSGMFFGDQTPEALAEAILRFEGMNFSAKLIRRHAEQFSRAAFRKNFTSAVERRWKEFRKGATPRREHADISSRV